MENRSALEMPALAQALSLAAVCLPQDGCAYDRITLDIVLATAANLLRHNRPENEVRLAILWQLPASAAEQLVPEHLRPDLKALAVFFDRTLDFLAADEPLEPDDIERQADEILAPIPDAARIVAAVHLKAIVDRSPKRVFYAADRPEPDRALFFTRLLALAKTFAAGTSDLTGERLLLSVKAAIRSARLKQTLLPDEMDDRIWLFQIRQEVPTEKREAILKRLDKLLSALWLKVGCVPGKNGEGTDPWRNDALYVLLEEARAENTPALERCMASLAVRFQNLFSVRRLARDDVRSDICWRLLSMDHWHMGLRYAGWHKWLCQSTSADPLAAIIQSQPESDLERAISAFENAT